MENNLIDKFIKIIGHESVAEYFEDTYGLITQKAYADKWVVKVQNGIEVCVSENDFEVVGEKNNINLDESYRKIDEILYKELEPIKNKIREGLKLHAFHGSDLINLNGDVKEDTKKMFEYVMNTTDIYDKAYVMQSVVDRVLEQYFNILKKVKEDNVL